MREITARRLAVAALLLAFGSQGQAQDAAGGPMEKCFGVALAGQDLGIGTGVEPGGSTVDYQGDAWTLVARGTCQTMVLPVQADGTPRRGAIRPLARDPAG